MVSWGFPHHLPREGSRLREGHARKTGSPLLHHTPCSFFLTKKMLQRSTSTYSPCLPLWSLPSLGFLVWVTAQTPASPLSSPLPVEDIRRQIEVLPPWGMGSRLGRGQCWDPGPEVGLRRLSSLPTPSPPVHHGSFLSAHLKSAQVSLPTAHLPLTFPFSCPGSWVSSLSASYLPCPPVQHC